MRYCKDCGAQIPDLPKSRVRCAPCQKRSEDEYRSAYKKAYYAKKRQEAHEIAGLQSYAYFIGMEKGADPDCAKFIGRYLPVGDVMKAQNGFLPEGLIVQINDVKYRVFLERLERIAQ